MLHGAILPGEQRFDEERWANDILNECHFNDRLWGYTIRVVEELHTCDPAVFTDRVLFNLMRLGGKRLGWGELPRSPKYPGYAIGHRVSESYDSNYQCRPCQRE